MKTKTEFPLITIESVYRKINAIKQKITVEDATTDSLTFKSGWNAALEAMAEQMKKR